MVKTWGGIWHFGQVLSPLETFSKACDLVPQDRLLTKEASSGVDSRVVFWVREFFVGRTQRVRVGGHLSKVVKVTSGAPQGSVLGPLLFVVYVNDVWGNIDASIRLFADDCKIYRNIFNNTTLNEGFPCFSQAIRSTTHIHSQAHSEHSMTHTRHAATVPTQSNDVNHWMFLNCNFSKEQSMLPEDDRNI